jgi:hypothetical protein
MEITHRNLEQIYPTIDQSILPIALQCGEYQDVKEMLAYYNKEEDLKEIVDLFCEKLTKHIEKQAVLQTKRTPKQSVKSSENQVKEKPKKEKSVKEKKVKQVKEKPEKPKPTAVERISPDVAVVKRYVNMYNKVKTESQILAFIKFIQKAIAEKVLRKTDTYAEEVKHIQKQLTKCYNIMGDDITIKFDDKTLEKYKKIANSFVVSDSVKLFKSFLTFMSNPKDRIAAKLLLSKCPNPKTDLEKSVVKTLRSIVDDGLIEISDQELNGILEYVGDDSDFDLSGFQKKKSIQQGNHIVNSEDLAKMHFETLPITGNYQKLIGTPSTNFKAMVYGSPGSGKTTFCLMFAEYLCKKHDKKVLFASIEEGINHTLQEKLNRMNATNPNLDIANHLPDDLTPYDVIFLDSVNTFGFDVKKLRLLSKSYPDKIFIWIFQTTKKGVFRGANEYQHDCDVVIEVKNYVASTENKKNRFNGNGTFQIFQQ